MACESVSRETSSTKLDVGATSSVVTLLAEQSGRGAYENVPVGAVISEMDQGEGVLSTARL